MPQYPYPAFDNSEVERLPGCAFWTDTTGTICLGFTKEGASLAVTQGVDSEKADESGDLSIGHVTKGSTAQLKLSMLQTEFARIVRVVPTAKLVGSTIRFGVQPGTRLATGKIVHRPFAAPDGSKDIVLDKACMVGDLNFVHKSSEPMVVDLTFEAELDESRSDGDLLGGGLGQ